MRTSTPDDYRRECLKNAEACLERASQDETRRSYWIEQAEEWVRRARGDHENNACASTHEIKDGRLVPKPSMN
jgi:hypothetical protein